jgi:hypothetical protein
LALTAPVGKVSADYRDVGALGLKPEFLPGRSL